MSDDCNEYIISQDKFIRNFDGMYENYADPWGQRETYAGDIAAMSVFHFLKTITSSLNLKVDDILDIGCADGYHSKHFVEIFGSEVSFVGTDISANIIKKATGLNFKETNLQFEVDDCRVFNEKFEDSFDVIFSSKTLYYVSPEIRQVISNVKKYLRRTGGVFAFVYNQSPNSFTSKWLTYESLRKLLLEEGFNESLFAEFSRFGPEATAVGVFSLRQEKLAYGT